MAQVYKTPDVYVVEKNAFPNSVVSVATAVPAFIGYTERAMKGRKSLRNVPTRISSFAEFTSLFGGAPKTTFEIEADPEKNYVLKNADARYYLYACMRFFYANGGGPCYIVSVGGYDEPVSASALNAPDTLGGLASLQKEREPTIVCVPDAMLLEAADCYSLQKEVLSHCGTTMKNRMAILDIHDGYKPRNHADGDVIANFRSGIGAHPNLQFGAAYYPWVETTLIQANEVGYTNISNPDGLKGILENEVDENLAAGFIKEKRAEEIKAVIAQVGEEGVDIDSVSNTLLAVSPMFKEIMKDLRKHMNMLPPSAAMAGLYSLVDNASGVHKSPANVGLSGVVAPVEKITSEEQEDLNAPLNGMAVNAIRYFVNKGTIVWGSRTLDGNSSDWRYINVRRTMIMLEESIRNAAGAYVFEPNDANTWVNMKGMLENFLTNQWKSGALAGSSPAEAFSVDIGLGVTMTPEDILEGLMKINVKVAISRPAEFVVITFQQQMQKS